MDWLRLGAGRTQNSHCPQIFRQVESRDAESIRRAFVAGRWDAEISADPSDRFDAVIVSQQWLDTESALTLVEQLLGAITAKH